MDRLLEFVINHPFLVSAFLIVFGLFVRNEVSRGGRGVTAQELVNLVNRDGALIVDVRDQKEFSEGHIVDAVNIPHAALGSRLSEIERHKAKPIVVTCKMGQHAGTAGTVLRKAGFENVSRLKGGIMEWRNQNLPVVKGASNKGGRKRAR